DVKAMHEGSLMVRIDVTEQPLNKSNLTTADYADDTDRTRKSEFLSAKSAQSAADSISERNLWHDRKTFCARGCCLRRRGRRTPPVCGVAPNSIASALPQSPAPASHRVRVLQRSQLLCRGVLTSVRVGCQRES